ncbi:proteophosphoglycan ppg4 [Leishmania tarentolae]|uniref:Proteophosphoglycan ppg4 n=1 Tax=Leishmania tarentolae TaxID=5689 RepID=A0A640L270_LEITA|nr:proteophosphoglycan ppg4 [Leishmania tarentolae]GET93899.1 proteophosphoglycan ppg4 [Leishmania tarentolae]
MGCHDAVPFYSPSEVENTRAFLLACRESFPALLSIWICPNFCTWAGVLCTPQGVIVNLSYMTLVGSLPSVPDGCDGSEVVVHTIDMGDPDMTIEVSGTLPENWSGLKRLESLDLSFTGVGGTLPPGWSELSSLSYLNLGYNKLSGALPPSWGFFSSLREIYLNDNFLSGTIPSSWMNLGGLEVLDLTNNQLGGWLPSLVVSAQRSFGAAARKSRRELQP